MDRAEYLKGINDFMYQGEVFGEAVADCYVHLEKDPERRYKWGTVRSSNQKPRRDCAHSCRGSA
jgi:hypothetical protein